jgi:hypothetical protein
MIVTDVPTWAGCALTYLLATGVKALAEVLLTRMKLAFALKLLHPPSGRDDSDAARKDLDAARKFITLSLSRPLERPRCPEVNPRRGHRYSQPTARGDADETTTAARTSGLTEGHG